MQVGFLGLGNIGAPMALRLLRAGHDVIVWNRTASKAAPLQAEGARVARSPAVLAEISEVVCLCLTDAQATESVVFGPDGLVAGAHLPRYVVDHSTVGPADTRRLASRLADVSTTTWIDAPVSGGSAGARAGTLATFAGGPADAVEAVRPVLEAFSSNITHMGPVGAGQAAKACNQLIGFLSFSLVAEALVLGSRLGLDSARLAGAFEGGFAAVPALGEWQRALGAKEPLRGPALHIEALRAFLSGSADGPDYTGPSAENLVKDLGIIRALARETATTLPMTEQMAVIHGLLRESAASARGPALPPATASR